MALVLWSLACYLSNPASVEALEERHEYSSQQAAISRGDSRGSREGRQTIPLIRKETPGEIRLGDKRGRRRYSRILGHIFFSRATTSNSSGRVLELVVLLSRAALEEELETTLSWGWSSISINWRLSPRLMISFGFKVMTRFTDYVFDMTGVRILTSSTKR